LIEILGALGMVAFLVSSLTIGVRLSIRGSRTGQLPELMVGCAFVVGGVAGYAPETVVLSTDLLSPAVEARVLLVTQLAIRLAAVCILIFTWKVFRPDSMPARTIAFAMIGMLLFTWWMYPQTRVLAENATDIFWYDAFTLVRATSIAWGAVESFLYYRVMQRQERLGLVEPIAVHRFWLWGVGLSVLTLLMASTLLAHWAGVDPASAGWVLLESAAGLVGATSLWLTFFPTEAYRRRMAARAQA